MIYRLRLVWDHFSANEVRVEKTFSAVILNKNILFGEIFLVTSKSSEFDTFICSFQIH